MPRLTTLGVTLASLLFLAIAYPEPSRAPATSASSETIEGCGMSGPRIDQGQTGIVLGETVLTVVVPDNGTFLSLPATGIESPALFICHVESGSSIVIDARTGEERSRTEGGAAGTAILDEIAANARVEAVVLPPPLPTLGPPAMTPPRTGDGGLTSP